MLVNMSEPGCLGCFRPKPLERESRQRRAGGNRLPGCQPGGGSGGPFRCEGSGFGVPPRTVFGRFLGSDGQPLAGGVVVGLRRRVALVKVLDEDGHYMHEPELQVA